MQDIGAVVIAKKLVNEKTFKHHRLYFHEGEWITTEDMDRATSSRESFPFSDTVHCDDDDIISLRFRSGPTSDLDLANADPDSPFTSLLEVSQDGAEEQTTGKFLGGIYGCGYWVWLQGGI